MKNLSIFSFVAILLSACLGSPEEPQPFVCNATLDISGVDQDQLATDVQIIEDYVASLEDEEIRNAIQTHPSGIRYRILEQGDGTEITGQCDVVSAIYRGSFLDNGAQFDASPGYGTTSATPIEFPLNNVISGWRVGIPLIQAGGQIILYIPSVYAYGSSGAGTSIPPNSILIFNVTIVDVLQRG